MPLVALLSVRVPSVACAFAPSSRQSNPPRSVLLRSSTTTISLFMAISLLLILRGGKNPEAQSIR
jgi:hypothetical protein